MITRVRIPKLSANIQEAMVTDWYKREGDAVRKGEPIAEMTTEKAAFEFESPRNGILRKILARRKSTLPVGYIVALVGPADDPVPDVSDENEKLLARHRRDAGSAPAPKRAARAPRRRVRATPAARRLARELKVDLALLKTTAGTDAITEAMVREHAGH
jgi:pyruvate dehydrogenase E2 component (dihydrolipoamide acetyltransferase)